MAHSDFLADLHARFCLPPWMVVGLVKRATAQRIVEVERLTLGEENEIHQARLADETTVYARIRPPGEGNFDQELWAMDQARTVGVPVPAVLAAEDLDTAQGRRSAMVLAAASGRPLAAVLPELSSEQRRKLLGGFGQVVARLHTVSAPGPGRPGLDGAWPDPDEVLRTFIANQLDTRPHLLTAGLIPSEVDAILALVGQSPDTPARSDPVLCHGDLHQAHVYVDEELQVSTLIDWGLWHGGTPVDELAYLSTKYDPDSFAAIVSGHGAGQMSDPAFRRRIALAVLNRIIGHLAWSERIGNSHRAQRYVEVLRSALAELSVGG